MSVDATVRQAEPEVSESDQAQAAVIRHQAAAFETCRDLDEAEYAARIRDNLAGAREALATAQGAQFMAEAAAEDAIEKERAQEDRFREFLETARQAEVDYQRVRARGTMSEQVESLKHARACLEVTETEKSVLDSLRTARELATRDLNGLRKQVVDAEEYVTNLAELEASPGRAEYSAFTCALNATHLMRHWETLTAIERERVKAAQRTEVTISGVIDDIRKEAFAEHEDRLRRENKLKPVHNEMPRW